MTWVTLQDYSLAGNLSGGTGRDRAGWLVAYVDAGGPGRQETEHRINSLPGNAKVTPRSKSRLYCYEHYNTDEGIGVDHIDSPQTYRCSMCVIKI